jgi:predicted phage-related endonuclease
VPDAEKQEHIKAVELWLNAIDMDMTPAGVKWSYETINRRYAKPEARTVELPSDTTELVARLKHVKAELKSYQELEDQLKAELCELLGDADTGTVNGTVVATWKGQTRDSLDIKAFKAACPDIAKEFSRQTTTRTLLLKGAK